MSTNEPVLNGIYGTVISGKKAIPLTATGNGFIIKKYFGL